MAGPLMILVDSNVRAAAAEKFRLHRAPLKSMPYKPAQALPGV